MGHFGRNAGAGPWQGCALSRTIGQSIPSDGTNYTAMTWDQEQHDPDDMHAGSDAHITMSGFTGVLTVSVAVYIRWQANTTGHRRARLIRTRAGATTIQAEEVSNPALLDAAPIVIGTIVVVQPGDTLHVEVLQNSGGALNALLVSRFAVAVTPS